MLVLRLLRMPAQGSGNPMATVSTTPAPVRAPAVPPAIPVIDGTPTPQVPSSAPVRAQWNPKRGIHRVVFKGAGKLWSAPKKTARRWLSLKNPSAVLRPPKATVGAVFSGLIGYGLTGMTGGAIDYGVKWAAGKAGAGAHWAVEPVADFVRLFSESALGIGLYPGLA